MSLAPAPELRYTFWDVKNRSLDDAEKDDKLKGQLTALDGVLLAAMEIKLNESWTFKVEASQLEGVARGLWVDMREHRVRPTAITDKGAKVSCMWSNGGRDDSYPHVFILVLMPFLINFLIVNHFRAAFYCFVICIPSFRTIFEVYELKIVLVKNSEKYFKL